MNIFSTEYPTLRLVWDSTSLNAFMSDPLDYYWRYVQGWRDPEKSIDLLWGTAWDKSAGMYHQTRGAGFNSEKALEATVWFAIGHAQKVDLDQAAADAPKDKGRKKNLATLIRALVWYDAEFGDYALFEPISTEPRLGKCELGITSPDGQKYLMVGNYDEIVREPDTGKLMVVERKTTTQAFSQYYWLDYDPSVQINTYDWLVAQENKIAGVLLEGCQTGIGFTRFAHRPVYRTPQQRGHWLHVMRFWIKFAEQIAMADDWDIAMNLATQRWESVTRNIERRSPAVWDGLLQVELEKRDPWNPLEID